MAKFEGTYERSVEDTDADDYFVELDYSDVDVFVASNVTTLTLTVIDTPSGVTAPTLGSPSYGTANKPLFQISGGTVGTVKVKAVAVNGASPPNKIVRDFGIKTI